MILYFVSANHSAFEYGRSPLSIKTKRKDLTHKYLFLVRVLCLVRSEDKQKVGICQRYKNRRFLSKIDYGWVSSGAVHKLR